MTTLRVASGQASAVCCSPAENALTAAGLTHAAAEQGVRLLALPEAFLTGYCREGFETPPAVEDLPALLSPVRAAAAAGGVTVVLCSPVVRSQGRTLSSVVIRPDGVVTAPYDKQHLSGYEKDYFEAGDHGTSIKVDGWEVALSICYDGSFPEHARAAADDGAQIYLNTAAFFVGGEHRRDLYYPARALDNGIFVLFSGLTGQCGDVTFSGGSAVYDPEGRPLAKLGRETGLAVADLDAGLMDATRANHPMHLDRRASLGARRR